MYFSALFVCVLAAVATSNVGGAQTGLCDIDGPFHGVPVETGPMPYDIIIEKTGINSGQTTKVTIKGKNSETFRGHIIVARSKADNSKVGMFSLLDDDSVIMDCGSGINGVMQSNHKDKREISVNWTAPANFRGEIYFKVVIVKVFDTYWVGQKSSSVTVS